MSTGEVVLAGIAGYLWGSVPSAYLLVRALKRIDLRRYGSGSIGIANAVQAAGMSVLVPLVVYDAFIKGWLPVFLASGVVLDLGVSAQVAIAAGVVAGHNWPLYLRFHGGRGITPSLGALLALSWPLLVVSGGVAGSIWAFTRNTPVAWLVATLILPAIAAIGLALPAGSVLGTSAGLLVFAVACTFLMLLRRVQGTWPGEQPPRPAGLSRGRVLLNRLLLDRDAASREEWIRRRPEQTGHGTAGGTNRK
jgi:glycerol-3-phosphate acyltransferase PlsY